MFSLDGSGKGQGYILNAGGTLNSPANPAAEGDVVTVFVNGGTPGVSAGAFVHGCGAQVLAAASGPVEGLPGNVYQLTLVVPRPSELNPDLATFKMPPTVSVHVVLHGSRSQNGITMSLK